MTAALGAARQLRQVPWPLVMLTLVVLIWSSNNIATKLVLQESTPALLTLVRFTTTTLAFHLPAFFLIRRFGQPLSRAEWVRLGIAAVLGYAASTLLFTIGLSLTTATYAALMLMTGPLWTAVLERVFLSTPIRPLQAVGMAISFVSAAFLATGGSLGSADLPMLLGSLLLMGAQTVWGGYTILTKPLLSRRPPLVVLTAANLIGTPVIWPVTGALGAWGDLALVASWSATTWLGMAYLIVVAGVFSQVLYIYGLRSVTPSQAMAFTYLMPVFTAFLAATLLDERLTVATVVCGALIVLGLWLMNRSRSNMPRVREAVGAHTPAPDPEPTTAR